MKPDKPACEAPLKSLFLKSPPTLLRRAIRGRTIKQAVNVEQKRVRPVKERAVDLLFRLDDGSLLHGEIQTRNHPQMEWRMLDHRIEFRRAGERGRIRQTVIYIGKQRMKMTSGIAEAGLQYRFQLVDVRSMDARILLRSSQPADVVLALLAGGVQDRRQLAGMVARRVSRLPEPLRAEALATLVLLSPLRDSETIVREAVMELELGLDWRKNLILRELYEEGLEEGKQEGKQEGKHEGLEEGIRQGRQQAIQDILLAQLAQRFGRTPKWAADRVRAADEAQVSRWARKVLSAKSIEALLGPRPAR